MRRMSVMAVSILLGSVAACSTTEPSPPPTAEDSLTDRAEASATATPDDAEQTSAAPTDAGEDPGIPELPEAATEDTEDGAEAFVQYYVDLLNYTGRVPQSGLLEPYGQPGCATCDVLEKETSELEDAGDRYKIDSLAVDSIEALPFESGYRVQLEGEALEAEILDAANDVVARTEPVPELDWAIQLNFESGGFLIEWIKSVEA